MPDDRRLYVDITTTLQEQRRIPHGTTRVEGGIVAALAARERPGVSYFAYDRAANRFALLAREEAASIALAARSVARRQAAPAWRRNFHGLLRGVRRRLGAASTPARPLLPAGLDLFEPGAIVLFAGELHRHDFAALLRLKEQRRAAFAFVFYDLLATLPDGDPRLLDAAASDIPPTDFLARHGALVLPISRFSAEKLQQYRARRGLAGAAVCPIRLAGRLETAPRASAALARLEPGRFVLTVGDVVQRKNHALLARVWRRLLASEASPPRLVIAGRIHPECWGFAFAVKKDRALRDAIDFESSIGDAQLAWLYANCRFTVFPSLLEGFGLPVAESLSCGKLCLSSSASAIPEAGQGLAVELDPRDEDAWYRAIASFWRNDALLAGKEADIRSRYRPVAWQDTACDILAAMNTAFCPAPGQPR